MVEVRGKPELVATFGKRQKRLSELKAKTEDGPIIAEIPHFENEEFECDHVVNTPQEVELHQTLPKGNGASSSHPTIDPYLVDYFKLIDEQELLVEDESED